MGIEGFDGLETPLHGACVLLGVAAAAALFVAAARRRRGLLDAEIVVLLAGALAGGALGSKLAVLWRYLDSAAAPSLVGLLVAGGQSVLGGLSGAYVGVILAKRMLGYRAGTGDLFAPAVALGIGIGRIGCLLTEVPGTPTGGGWGVVVDAARAAQIAGFPPRWVGVPLHPSFLYEIPFHLAMAAVLLRLRARGVLRGELFTLYCLAYAPVRFALEAVRGNAVVWLGLTRSQLFLVPATLALAVTFARRLRRERRAGEQPSPLAAPSPPLPAPLGLSADG
jgi:phosphatidylglycerol:prolipoprotein diacylglycerol transferase